jgi:hypothetical protein
MARSRFPEDLKAAPEDGEIEAAYAVDASVDRAARIR